MKKYAVYIVFFFWVVFLFTKQTNEKEIINGTKQYYISSMTKINNMQKSHFLKETLVFFISAIVSFIFLITNEVAAKQFCHRENQTSHYSMKHRMQNPRCKLKNQTQIRKNV